MRNGRSRGRNDGDATVIKRDDLGTANCGCSVESVCGIPSSKNGNGEGDVTKDEESRAFWTVGRDREFADGTRPQNQRGRRDHHRSRNPGKRRKIRTQAKDECFLLDDYGSENPQLSMKLDSLQSKSVVLKGEVDCPKSKTSFKTLKIIPTEVEAD